MGYISHKVFVVTASGYQEADERLEEARTLLMETFEKSGDPFIGPTLTEIVMGINGCKSFAVLPDGSKEEWEVSDTVDAAIEEAITLIKTFAYSDGSNPLTWVWACFDDDYGQIWMRTEALSVSMRDPTGKGDTLQIEVTL